MASATIVLKNKNAVNKTAVVIMLRFNNEYVKFATGKSIEPKNWSIAKGEPKNNYIHRIELNLFLKGLKEKILNELLKFENEQGRTPTRQEIRTAVEKNVLNKEESEIPKDFFGYYSYFIESQKGRISPKTGRPITQNHINNYKRSLKKLQAFEKISKKPLTFDGIDKNFYQEYFTYLKSTLGLADGTTGKEIKNLKAVMYSAVSDNITQNNNFQSKDFKVLKNHKDEIYLTFDELKELRTLDLSDKPHLDRTRDCFIMLAYTGQRYQSLKDLFDPKNRSEDIIELKQAKTNKKVSIPILEPVRYILDKYKDDTKIGKTLNQVLNRQIKEVGKMVGSLNQIVKLKDSNGNIKSVPKYTAIYTHTGRRSFATNFYKNADLGLTLNEIMSITGHSEKTFFSYIRTTSRENALSSLKKLKNLDI